MKDKNDNNRIAGKRTINEWEILKKSLDANIDVNWDDAYDFFEKRITTRYLNSIERILNMRLFTGEGFAVVHLQCSLIETIESFFNGWIYNHPKFIKNGEIAKWEDDQTELKNKHIFISFFRHREPFNNQIDGEDFYLNVRCGLLHETQTKNGWIIKTKHLNADIFYENIMTSKILYRNNFQMAIKKLLENYKEAIVGIIAPNKVVLRENFMAKIDRICDLSR